MGKSKTAVEPLAIGVDIGGTGTKFGIVDHVGNVLFSGHLSTRKHAQVETFIEDLYTHLKILIDKAGGIGRMKGIGVGARRLEGLEAEGRAATRGVRIGAFQHVGRLVRDDLELAIGILGLGDTLLGEVANGGGNFHLGDAVESGLGSTFHLGLGLSHHALLG